jgi:hypothetical protein
MPRRNNNARCSVRRGKFRRDRNINIPPVPTQAARGRPALPTNSPLVQKPLSIQAIAHHEP